MSEETIVKVIIKNKEYIVPLTYKLAIVLKELIGSGGSGSGSGIPEGYNYATDGDIDNLFP